MRKLQYFMTTCAIALATTPVFAQAPASPAPDPDRFSRGWGYGHMWGGGPMWGGGYGWYPGMIIGPIVMVLILVGIIAIIVSLVRWFSHGTQHGHGHPPFHDVGRGRGALDIIEERFARGEIDKAEFDEKRRILRGS